MSEVRDVATDMTLYEWLDATDAFVATDAFQDARGTLLAWGLVALGLVWLWQHFNSGKPRGT